MKNKRLIMDVLLVCSFIISTFYVFQIHGQDYIMTKYYLSYIMFFQLVNILLNILYILLYFDMIQYYINMKKMIVIRIGEKKYRQNINFRIIAFILVYFLINTFTDTILMNQFLLVEIVLSIVPFLISFVVVNFLISKIGEITFQFIWYILILFILKVMVYCIVI